MRKSAPRYGTPSELELARDRFVEVYLLDRRKLTAIAADLRRAVSNSETAVEAISVRPLRPVPGELPDVLFGRIDAYTRDVAHAAYVSVVALVQILDDPLDDIPRRDLDRWAIDRCRSAAIAMLDALELYVSRADRGLRRVLLDGEPFERVAADILRAG